MHIYIYIHTHTYIWRRKWQPTPVFLSGKVHGRRSLVGYSPWDFEEADITVTSLSLYTYQLPPWLNSKETTCNTGDLGLIPVLGRTPWRRKRQPTPVFFPGKSYRQRSLVSYSPWGHKSCTWLVTKLPPPYIVCACMCVCIHIYTYIYKFLSLKSIWILK